jgi:four helix bundle protein
LKDQINKSALSISSNIAEGAERDSLKEFIHFLHIAKGSSAELRTQLYIADNIEFLNSEITSCLISETKEISSMLHGFIKLKNTNLSRTLTLNHLTL